MSSSQLEAGHPAPSFALVDQDCVIAHRWKRVGAKGHAEKVKQKLEELQSWRS
jgi:peroxiredoxin